MQNYEIEKGIGCGCLVVILVILGAIIYPFYDGYYTRSISSSDYSSWNTNAYLYEDRGKVSMSVSIEIDNEWILEEAVVWVSFDSDEDHPSLSTVFNGDLNYQKNEQFSISRDDGKTYLNCTLSEKVTETARRNLTNYRWGFLTMEGRRKPINLAKGLVDWTKNLFERE